MTAYSNAIDHGCGIFQLIALVFTVPINIHESKQHARSDLGKFQQDLPTVTSDAKF